MTLQIEHVRTQAGHVVRLSGVIDESLESDALVKAISSPVVVFDLGGVERITSFGVRAWVKALRALPREYCGFAHCRPALVSQFNMVAHFGAGGELVSFYAPYVCAECGEETELLIDLRRQHEDVRNFSPPSVRCPKCKGETEFDDVAESFFSFAAASPPPNPPLVFDSLLDGTGSVSGPRVVALRVDLEVLDDFTVVWFSGQLDKTAHFKQLSKGLEGTVLLVLQDVAGASEDGLSRLKALLQAEGARFLLGRVPMSLAPKLPQLLAAAGHGSVVSLWLDTPCEACGARELPLEGADRGTCANCAASLRTPPAPEWLQQLRGSLRGPLPEAVAAFLRSRTQPERPAPHSPPPALPPYASATPLFGRYELLHPIGSGGMAEVYLARQTGVAGFEKNVVVKRILPHFASDEAFVSMFLQEARVAARVSHQNVVQIFDLGQEGTEYFIAMEYVKGWDLHTALMLSRKLQRDLPLPVAIRITANVCAGLHAAHASTGPNGEPLGLIHRDVSPHNVLLSDDGQVKLTDFGVAKALNDGEQTPTSSVKGKVGYLAPEQISRDFGQVDHRVDVFTAGILLFECVTLEHPFRKPENYGTLVALMEEAVPKLSLRRPGCGERLQAVLERALERHLPFRHPSAQALQQDLETILREMGHAAGALEIADWLRQLVADADARGLLPARRTAQSPSAAAATLEPAPGASEEQTMVLSADYSAASLLKGEPE